MLQIVGGIPIANDAYYIQHMEDGLDELHFEILLSDPAYHVLNEEVRVKETTEGQTFLVKTIDGGSKTACIGCQLDLDDWKAACHLNYTNHNSTVGATLRAICPEGWEIAEATVDSKKRDLAMDGPTPLEIALQCEERYGCAIRFDNRLKRATVVYPDSYSLSNAYAVESVNLTEKPEFKGKSSDIYTRLYPIGKDGLGIAAINGGKAYVENHDYTDRVICKIWSDSRYTDAQSLRDDAQAKVNEAAMPVRSWNLSIADLHRIDPARWPEMGISLFTVLALVDTDKALHCRVQVREDKVYPYYPEKNKITVSTVTGSVQRTLRSVYDAINNANSSFYQKLNAK